MNTPALLLTGALLTAPALAQGCPGSPDALEPSDNCATAPVLGNGIVTGLTVEDVNRDYYTMTLAPNEQLTCSVLFTHAVGDLDVHLWDTAVACDSVIEGEFAASALLIAGSGTDDEVFIYLNGSGVTQTVVIEVGIWSQDPATCVPYDIDIDVMSGTACGMADAFEDNDDCLTAVPILDGVYAGLNVTRSDADIFSLSVADGDTLDITMVGDPAPNGDIDVYLWDPTIDCGTASAGEGGAPVGSLAVGFAAGSNEAISYTNITGATQNLILEMDVWDGGSSSGCNPNYTLTISGSTINGPTGIGSPFCLPNPNSTGVPGLISATGSTVAIDNDVTLNVAQIPAGEFGIFVVSMAAGSMTPVNQGILCLSGPTGRYDQAGFIWQADAGGEASRVLDLQMIPTPTAFVGTSSGDTWFFQAWHRDVPPAPGQPGSNFTNGVGISFN